MGLDNQSFWIYSNSLRASYPNLGYVLGYGNWSLDSNTISHILGYLGSCGVP